MLLRMEFTKKNSFKVLSTGFFNNKYKENGRKYIEMQLRFAANKKSTQNKHDMVNLSRAPAIH